MLKGQGGITLVALVVTIIVLIILATVSISIVTNSELIPQAQNVADLYANIDERFERESNVASQKIDAYFQNYIKSLPKTE